MARKVLVVLTAILALSIASGAGAGTKPKIDLSTREAINALLQAKGIDPATVVTQVGPLNYAGPHCPGPGWNCTTSTRVVQISHEGDGQESEGDNEFECGPGAVPPTSAQDNVCFIVQGGKNNNAHCEEQASTEPTAAEVCDVTQTGNRNSVEIQQSITQTAGPGQTAEQTARVEQHAVEKNTSQVHQDVVQKTSVSLPQAQNAYQKADVSQDVSGSLNYSHIHQTQDQNESGAAATQDQNTVANSAFNCGDEKPGAPNQCANVYQDATPNGGTNMSHLHQLVGERQTSTFPGVNQTQGNLSGGLEGNVHQQNPPGIGVNVNLPHQDERQRQSSPSGVAIQKQVTDPGCCGVGTQIGGAKTTERIDQSVTQSADEPAAEQNASFFGQSHQVPGEVPGFAPVAPTTTPENHCSITQHGRNNGGGDTFTQSGNNQAECADLFQATMCQYPPGEGPPCATVTPCEVLICDQFLLTPTNGTDIAMPDYTAEPADYTPPSP